MSTPSWSNAQPGTQKLCTRFVLPRMLERGSGNVINVALQLG